MANPTIVLVHGAFADASGFRGLYDQLLGEDVTVVAPLNLLRSQSGGDGEYLKAVIDEIDRPVQPGIGAFRAFTCPELRNWLSASDREMPGQRRILGRSDPTPRRRPWRGRPDRG